MLAVRVEADTGVDFPTFSRLRVLMDLLWLREAVDDVADIMAFPDDAVGESKVLIQDAVYVRPARSFAFFPTLVHEVLQDRHASFLHRANVFEEALALGLEHLLCEFLGRHWLRFEHGWVQGVEHGEAVVLVEGG